MSEPTARDELLTLLGEHQEIDFSGMHCTCGAYRRFDRGGYRAHLADVLIAAGWTKGQP